MAKRNAASVMDDFDYEFHSEVDQPLDELKAEVEARLRKLADGHTDMIGATVSIDEPAENRSTPFVYRARIVAYVRPEDVAATEQADTVEGALKGALQALERQVRERRAKLRERWKHST
jgi:ribosome-associated translation inhibitor RaiA